jgi:stigma-specific protein Stig1
MATRPEPHLLAGLLAGLALLGGCATAEPCPRPLQECGGACTDVASSVDHCGGCDRRCTAGLACVVGQCVPDPGTSCTTRRGGAFVTFEACGAALKTWITSPAFTDQADAMRLGTAPPRVPVLELLAGADCDDQWSFHPDPSTPTFADAAVEVCDACPAEVQADLAAWLGPAHQWCPSTARVVAVDRRP